MNITDANIALAFKGFQTVYNTAFEATEIFHPKMAMQIESSASEETYGWLGQFPQMREWQGERFINRLTEHGFTIHNKKFESTVEVRRTDMEDDRYGIFEADVRRNGPCGAPAPRPADVRSVGQRVRHAGV